MTEDDIALRARRRAAEAESYDHTDDVPSDHEAHAATLLEEFGGVDMAALEAEAKSTERKWKKIIKKAREIAKQVRLRFLSILEYFASTWNEPEKRGG